MLAVVAPERLADVRAVCEKWGLASAVIATLVPGDTLTIRHEGEIVAQLSASSLADDGPEYDRPLAPDDVAETVDDPAFIPFEGDLREALVDVLSSPNIASKRWIFEQYDSFVQGQTVASAGSDAAVDPGPRHAEGARAVERRQGPVRSSGPVPGGRARRRGGRAQRRGHRREAARDHELHELRQPGAPGRDVAVRRGDPRDARRVPGVRHAGHRRERQLLQRVGRLGDLADAGDRHARAAGGLPPAGADGVRARGVVDLRPGRDVRRAGRVGVRRRRARRDLGPSAGAGSGARAGAPRPVARGGERRPAGRRPRLQRRRAGGDARRAGHPERARVRGHRAGRPPAARGPLLRIGVACGRRGGARARRGAGGSGGRARRAVRDGRGDGRAAGGVRRVVRDDRRTSSATSTRARSRGCWARTCDPGRHVRLLGDPRVGRRGDRRGGGRHDARAAAPPVVGDPGGGRHRR